MFFVQRLLVLIVGATVLVDATWTDLAHFDLDKQGYLALLGLTLALAAGGTFYGRSRPDSRLSAMLFGCAFLVCFSASFSLLNYLLLTVAGHRIDLALAAADRAMGFNWPAMMAAMANHPALDFVFRNCYLSVLPQVALLIVALSGCGHEVRVYEACLAIALAAIVTVLVWTIFPSFGAFAVYDLPASLTRRLDVALDGRYAHELQKLLASGPGFISPRSARGLVGFPSYHAALAVIVAWHMRPVKMLFWPVAAIDVIVLVATPIQGGHHVVDVIAGLGVAILAIAAARWASSMPPAIREVCPLRTIEGAAEG